MDIKYHVQIRTYGNGALLDIGPGVWTNVQMYVTLQTIIFLDRISMGYQIV